MGQEIRCKIKEHVENTHLALGRLDSHTPVLTHETFLTIVAVHASVSNHFNQERSLSSRPVFKANRAAALTEWRGLCAE